MKNLIFLAAIDLVSVLHSAGNDLWPDCMMCIDLGLLYFFYSIWFSTNLRIRASGILFLTSRASFLFLEVHTGVNLNPHPREFQPAPRTVHYQLQI